MSHIWAFSHINGWYQIDNFLEAYHEANDTSSGDEDLVGCGYDDYPGFYNILDPSGSYMVGAYRLKKSIDNRPEFIIQICLNNSSADYIGANSVPDALELLNKIAPLAQATLAGEDLKDKWDKEFNKKS